MHLSTDFVYKLGYSSKREVRQSIVKPLNRLLADIWSIFVVVALTKPQNVFNWNFIENE